MICIALCRGFIWIWGSCGAVRCHGVRCGKGRFRTVWTMSDVRMMFLQTLDQPAWTNSFHPGLFGVRFGPKHFDQSIRVFRQKRFCSVRFTCRWCIIIGCVVRGCPTSLSGGTIWTGCECSCISRWLSSSVRCLLRLRAARVPRGTLARVLREALTPGTGRPDPPEKTH